LAKVSDLRVEAKLDGVNPLVNDTIVKCQRCGTRNRIPAAKQHRRPKCGHCHEILDLSSSRLPAVELTDANFNEFLAATVLPVMVDFFSPTCGPCRTMLPVVEGLANRYLGRAVVAKLNTAANPAVSARFAIRGVPAFLFFRQGQLVEQIAGAVPEEMLAWKLDTLL
jgi:thioredoxin 2